MSVARTLTVAFPGIASAATAAAAVNSDPRWRGKITVTARHSNILHLAGPTPVLRDYLHSLKIRGVIAERIYTRAHADLAHDDLTPA